jgi:polysaccharide transporter, PST family
VKKPLQNFLSLVWSDLGSRAIGFFITVYLARVLGPAAYGLVSVGLAVLGHAQLLSSPGIQVVEARNAARPEGMSPERFGGVLVVRVVLSVLMLLIAWGAMCFLSLDPRTTAVLMWSLAVLFPLAIAPDWFLQGRERMGPLGMARVTGYLIYGAFVWLLVGSTVDVALAPAAYCAGSLGTAVVLWIAVRREFVLPRITFDVRLWLAILRENLPVGFAMFVGQMVMNLPPLLLAVMWSNSEAGVYNAALKLVFLLLAIDRVLNALLLPAMTRVRETRPEDLARVTGLSIRIVLSLAGLIIVPGMFIVPTLLGLVFGGAYTGAESAARILLVYVGLTLLNSVAVCVLIASGQERVYSKAMVFGSIILAAAMVALTPLWGVTGTAIGAVIGELATVSFMMYAAAREVTVFIPAAFVRPVLASCCAVLPGIAVASLSSALAAVVAGGAVIILLAFFRVFSVADVLYVKERFL